MFDLNSKSNDKDKIENEIFSQEEEAEGNDLQTTVLVNYAGMKVKVIVWDEREDESRKAPKIKTLKLDWKFVLVMY